jgi:membrane protein implicated in regulation of membrane protease activity
MADPNPKPAPGNPAGTILMASILLGAVMIAAIGTLLPGWIGLTGTPALIIALVFYAVAAIDVAIAFWLRARIAKARQASGRSGNTIQHMR